MSKKPYVLITNDDGVDAPGILALCRKIKEIADIIVVAPVIEKSGVSNAITLTSPLRIYNHPLSSNIDGWAVNGTPADCVKIALKEILEKKPDLIISGINLGENSGVNIIYSGTVAAAAEGAIQNIPSFAISLATHEKFDFQIAANFAAYFANELLKQPFQSGIFYNVNVPACAPKSIQGVRITTQGNAPYQEKFEQRIDPRKQIYYWLGGKKKPIESDLSVDENAIEEKYISVCPLQLDLTHYQSIEKLKTWNLNFQNIG